MGTESLTKLRVFLDGGVGVVIGNRGTGKTAAAVFLTLIELQNDPSLDVYGNVRINAPRCHYTPYLFLPFDDMSNIILIVDDASKIENIRRYAKIVSNNIRKIKGDIVFTAQYDKQIPPEIRAQYNYRIYPQYKKSTDELNIRIRYEGGERESFTIKDMVKKVKAFNLYDTREIVPYILKRDAIREIAKISKTPRDIEDNLMLFTGDKKERKNMTEEVLNHPKYTGEKTNNDKDQNGWWINEDNLVSLYRQCDVSYLDIETCLGIPHSTANSVVKNYKK
jgi:hypothetical protein